MRCAAWRIATGLASSLTLSAIASTCRMYGTPALSTLPACASVAIALHLSEIDHGDRFRALFDRGDISRYGDDHSAADWALVRMLYTSLGPDPVLIGQLFRSSALYRAKWDRRTSGSTYGAITISKAISASM